jgi:predicted nucleotidyltransferase
MPDGDSTASKVELLEQKLSADWPAIRKARDDTASKREKLDELFREQTSPDTSLVVFGSVGRKEVTSSSDLDWILLIDGQSAPEHQQQTREIERILAANEYIEPGKSGVFGGMVGSHPLVHNIGGENDSNSNTTRRVLLLLESLPIGNLEARQAYDRVRRQVLRRYLEDDRGLSNSSSEIRIPRFLLNDLTRYWRTVTVDFAYKQRAQNDKKWALRNAKLRMSRKLLFAAGLLHCFFCHLDAAAGDARQALTAKKDVSPLTTYMESQLSLTPLDLVAKACLEQKVTPTTARSIFDSYDRFLAIIDDPVKRSELEKVQSDNELRESKVWNEVREVSRPFHGGLVALFLSDDDDLKELTMQYGMF